MNLNIACPRYFARNDVGPRPVKYKASIPLEEMIPTVIDDADAQEAIEIVDDDILNDTVDRVSEEFNMAYDMLDNFCGTATLSSAIGQAMEDNAKSRVMSAWRLQMLGYLAVGLFGVFIYLVFNRRKIQSTWN